VGAREDDDQITSLALAAGRGDRGALNEFIRATQRDVWRTVAHLADPSSADDLIQETYLRALRALPGSRHALLLTQVLGLSYAEAAEVCGCPVGTIRSRVARARDDLLNASRHDDLTG
jgi:DNA-directed RNA polymerase specialized sigma24 family protein